MLGTNIGKGGIRVTQMIGKEKEKELEIDCALLRHLGIIKDFEQFGSRLWSVRAIEQAGVYVMNPLTNWLFATDKLASIAILAKNGVPVPETESSENFFTAYGAVKRFGRAVVKPLRSAMGFGVFKVDDADVGMHIFSYFTNLSKPIYVQEYLEKKGGGDYRIVVVGDEILGCEFRKGSGWKSNIAQGATPKPGKLDSEMRELALKSVEALGLDFGGVDIAETRDGYYVLEVNPTLSWQGFKVATKVNPAIHIVRNLIDKVRHG